MVDGGVPRLRSDLSPFRYPQWLIGMLFLARRRKRFVAFRGTRRSRPGPRTQAATLRRCQTRRAFPLLGVLASGRTESIASMNTMVIKRKPHRRFCALMQLLVPLPLLTDFWRHDFSSHTFVQRPFLSFGETSSSSTRAYATPIGRRNSQLPTGDDIAPQGRLNMMCIRERQICQWRCEDVENERYVPCAPEWGESGYERGNLTPVTLGAGLH